MKIVYRDEIEIGVGRRIFAAQTSGPRAKRKERAGTEPNPLPASERGRHEETLGPDRPIVSVRPASFQLPDAERAGEKSHTLFKVIVGSNVRSQRLHACRRFDHLVVLHC